MYHREEVNTMTGSVPNIYRRARHTTPYTQEQAAEYLFVSDRTVKAWENGERVPDDETVRRMAEIYERPQLLLEHALTTDSILGVLPGSICIQSLPTAVLALINRTTALTEDYRKLMTIAEDGVIDEAERPTFDTITADIQSVIAAAYQVIYAVDPEGQSIKKDRVVAGTTTQSMFPGRKAKNDCTSIVAHRPAERKDIFCRNGGGSL